jgi:AraC-like DNA-binding protein
MKALLAMIGAGLEAAGVFEPAPEAIEANALQRSKWFIEQNLHDPQLDAAAVVAATSLSRSSLYRLFQVHDGLARYIRSRRLDRAQAAFTNPFDRRNISEIAYAVGFRDLPQFSRAYRSRFGVTPSMTRRGES